MPGRRPRQAEASMPPLTMGTSTDFPVRLSVIVADSSATSVSSRFVAVHVGLPLHEAHLLVQLVGRLARGPRGELDGAGAMSLGMVDGRLRQRRRDATATGGLVDDDVL